jgi:methyl-accepting chemotaxis protein
MTRFKTFGKKVGAGFASIVFLAIAMGVLAVCTLRGVCDGKDRVITVDARSLVEAENLRAAIRKKIVGFRTYLLVGKDDELEEMQQGRRDFLEGLARLRGLMAEGDPDGTLKEFEETEAAHELNANRVVAMKQSGVQLDDVVRAFETDVDPVATALEQQIDTFRDRQEQRLEEATSASTELVSSAIKQLVFLAVLTGVLASGVAIVLTRTTTRQIGEAVGQVQSSSAELQATANQQATGAKEQATAMSEITTTISELLATSQQIAESAQHVAGIAADTTHSARGGENTVEKAQDSFLGIRKQVDLIVNHMLDLGEKSQQIGAVLDIDSELAEQTNI